MSCEHVYKTGKHAGERCTVKPRAGTRCSEHIRRHQVDPAIERAIVGGPPRDPEAKKRHGSQFRITVNTNRSAAKTSVRDIEAFKMMIREVFSLGHVEEYLVDRTNLADPRANILTIDAQMFFEKGDLRHMVHTHGWVKLTHTGNYMMNFAALRGVLEGVYGRKLHLDIKAEPLNDVVWEEYARKHASSERLV